MNCMQGYMNISNRERVMPFNKLLLLWLKLIQRLLPLLMKLQQPPHRLLVLLL